MLGRLQRFLLSVPQPSPATQPTTQPQPLLTLEHYHDNRVWPTLLVQSQLSPQHILHRIIEDDDSNLSTSQPRLYSFPTAFPQHTSTLPQHVTPAAYSRCVRFINATGRLTGFDWWWMRNGLPLCFGVFFVTLALVLAAAVSQLGWVVGVACGVGVAWLLMCGVWDNVHRRCTLECNVRLHRTLQHVNRWLSKQTDGEGGEAHTNGDPREDEASCVVHRPCYIVACRVLSGVRHSLRGGVHEFYKRELIWMATETTDNISERHSAYMPHSPNGQVLVALSRGDSCLSNRD